MWITFDITLNFKILKIFKKKHQVVINNYDQ